MNINDLEEKFKNMHLLDRSERTELTRKLAILKPEFMKSYAPDWWRFAPCVINVLIVCDGGLNFGTGDFDLSEFLTTFNRLEESSSNADYRVTIAHRGGIIVSPNPVIVGYIPNFEFDTSVNLTDFDQVWLFAIDFSDPISASEIAAIENYMNGGGGLFATGDHGILGRAMCGNIPRVKDMRYWNDTSSNDDINEVSMSGRRRNDTNTPRPGQSIANTFEHQSDKFPQKISVRTFGLGNPHPLLSISTNIRASGIIEIMPDHPHEGECKPETTFDLGGSVMRTQNIATSFVNGGNTSGGKTPTDPHCFPSIGVFDGRKARAGRIVVDSTWHHFININLNGGSTGLGGLSDEDFEVIQQYYMNISTWITRRKAMVCLSQQTLVELLKNSQLIESTLINPKQRLEEVSLSDLNSVGTLAEEILAVRHNPVFARTFFLELLEDYNPEFADMMDVWKSKTSEEDQRTDEYYQNWINLDLILRTSIGAAFIALRDNEEIGSQDMREESLGKVRDVFVRGLEFGFNAAVRNMNSNLSRFSRVLNERRSE